MTRTRWLVWFVFAAVLTTVLLLPPRATSALSPLEERPTLKLFVAKSLHVFGYATFAALSAWLRAPRRLRWFLFAFLFVHAGTTEALQLLVDRGGSLRDVGIDAIGIALGTALTWKWWTTKP